MKLEHSRIQESHRKMKNSYYRAVARIIFQPRQRGSVDARLLLVVGDE